MLKKILFKLKKQILKDAYQRAEEKNRKNLKYKTFCSSCIFKNCYNNLCSTNPIVVRGIK